ncbi:MAG: pimeloyl-ACP methyl ester carboxylesterase [Cellvibrionaceae bacterium]|jgi:pimeloyl-ACP methyl ester carboxylesterase
MSGTPTIYYEEIGAGEPLPILHGGGAALESFAGKIPFFKPRVIAIDTRDHGRGNHGNKRLSYAIMASDTITVLDCLTIEKTNFIGWSDGWNTAILLALNHPERVQHLTLISANYHPDGVVDNSPI